MFTLRMLIKKAVKAQKKKIMVEIKYLKSFSLFSVIKFVHCRDLKWISLFYYAESVK